MDSAALIAAKLKAPLARSCGSDEVKYVRDDLGWRIEPQRRISTERKTTLPLRREII